MGNHLRVWLLSLLMLGGLAACDSTRQASPYEGTFIYGGGGP